MKFLYRGTIDWITHLLFDLSNLGEIGRESMRVYGLADYHLLMVLESGLVHPTPYGCLASQRLLNLTPISDENELLKKIGLPKVWNNTSMEWATFHQKVFDLRIEEKHFNIDPRYLNVPIPNLIFEETINRPIILYKYISPETDLDEWDINGELEKRQAYTEEKRYIHSVLPITDSDVSPPSIWNSVWRNPFYWSALQILILSDHGTGAAYEDKITVFFLDGFDDDGKINVYFDNQYVCDFSEVLPLILNYFHWVWVNKSNEVMHVFKLLYKFEIMEKERDGRGVLTDNFRSKLFERDSSYKQHYRESHSARDSIRELIRQNANRIA